MTPSGIEPATYRFGTYPPQFLICCCCCCFCSCCYVVVVFDLARFLFNGARVQIPSQPKKFSFFQNVYINSEAYPITHSMGTGVFLRRIKRSGREVDHLPPTSAEVKNEWSYTSSPPIPLHDIDRDNSVSLLNVLENDRQFVWF
jgi:hypothetical protein